MTAQRTLAVDVGGTGIKAVVFDAAGQQVGDHVRIPTEYPCPPSRLAHLVADVARALPTADRAGVGFPGLVRSNRVVWVNSLTRARPDGPTDPDLAREWVGCPIQDLIAERLGVETIVANDADVAALASVRGEGLECVITLGTGLGSSLILDGTLLPHLELGGMPFAGAVDLEDALGNAGLERDGQTVWTANVHAAIEALRRVLYFDHLYIGGGNSRLIDPRTLPDGVTTVDNTNGLVGGFLLFRGGDERK